MELARLLTLIADQRAWLSLVRYRIAGTLFES